MSPGSVATVALVLFISISRISDAQLIERTDEGLVRFTDNIVGKWNTEEVIFMGKGRTTTNESAVFETNTWTSHGINGDSVLELSDFNESSDPLEVTFVRPGHRDRSITAFMSLDDSKLTIVYGSKPQYPNPLPKSMESGPETVVLRFKRSVDDEFAVDNERLPLTVRLLEGANNLVDVTIKPFFGGKLRYSSERLGRRLEQEKSPQSGIVIDGSVVPSPDGNRVVSLSIEIGSKQHSDDPKTTIVRSEKLQITTVVTPGKTARIKCGEDRTCELILEVE